MLRSSWDLVVQASLRRVSLVPSGSPSDQIAEGLLPSNPWLLHRVPETPVEPEQTAVSFAEGRRLIERLAELQHTEGIASKFQEAVRSSGTLSVLEQSLLTATLPFGGAAREERDPPLNWCLAPLEAGYPLPPQRFAGRDFQVGRYLPRPAADFQRSGQGADRHGNPVPEAQDGAGACHLVRRRVGGPHPSRLVAITTSTSCAETGTRGGRCPKSRSEGCQIDGKPFDLVGQGAWGKRQDLERLER